MPSDHTPFPTLDVKFPHGISLLAWAYNEELLIEDFLKRAFTMMDRTVTDFEVVVVDDGSTDNTPNILANYARTEPRLRIITHPRNLNIGVAVKTALAAAEKEFLFWQTVDWSYDLTHFRLFIELLHHYDAVIGVRPTSQTLLAHIPLLRSLLMVRKRSDSFYRAIISLINYYVLHVLYHVGFHDYQNVHFYRTTLVHSITLQGGSSMLSMELAARAMLQGTRFLEVPIPFIPRSKGVAKGARLGYMFKTFFDILGNWLRWGWQVRLAIHRIPERRVFRLTEPYHLEEEVLRLTAPLFKYFR